MSRPSSRAALTDFTVFDDSYSSLAGSHRVQRVSDTEKRGRRHSSDVTVVVFDNDLEPRQTAVSRRDVRVDTFRDSGPGGQHRNKTESGVRMTHLPTGTVVTAVEERSQHLNRQVAWERLCTRLAETDYNLQHEETNAQRQETLSEFRSWTWCGWRDEVKGPEGQKASMKRSLAGKLDLLIRAKAVESN